MPATLLLLAMLLASGCSSQTDRELEAVKSARSVLSEWALVEHQAARGRTPTIYAEDMRKQARDQLRTAQSSLIQSQPAAAGAIGRIIAGQPTESALTGLADALGPLENQLEHS